MEIQKIEINKLKPLPFNPKIHPESQIDRIVKSLNEFGFTNPILATKDNYIMAGHGRIEAARKAGIEKVPVIYFDFNLNKAKAYNIADNRLAELAEDDVPKLKDMLQELDTGNLDMEALGYSDDELEDLINKYAIQDIDDLLQELDLSEAIDKPIWLVVRTKKENQQLLEDTIIQLEEKGIRIERSYEV